MEIQSFTFGPFLENTYVVYDHTREGMVIDPGCSNQEEVNRLDDFISSNEIQLKLLVNTHCHVDHVLGNAHVKQAYQVPLLIHALEEQVLRAVKVYAPTYGFDHYEEATPDRYMTDGQSIKVGDTSWKVIHLPGHSPGHVGLYAETEQVLLGGDVLFEGSIGRTDLPGGNHDQLIGSIRERLFTLPESITVYAGHGATTTIGKEKATNPFFL